MSKVQTYQSLNLLSKNFGQTHLSTFPWPKVSITMRFSCNANSRRLNSWIAREFLHHEISSALKDWVIYWEQQMAIVTSKYFQLKLFCKICWHFQSKWMLVSKAFFSCCELQACILTYVGELLFPLAAFQCQSKRGERELQFQVEAILNISDLLQQTSMLYIRFFFSFADGYLHRHIFGLTTVFSSLT